MQPEANILRTAAGALIGGARAVGRGGAALARGVGRAAKAGKGEAKLPHYGAALGALGIGTGVLLLLNWQSNASSKRGAPSLPKRVVGRPVCPSAGADVTDLKPGDFVMVTVGDQAGQHRESTWARVVTVGKMLALQLTGEVTAGKMGEMEPVPLTLQTSEHGFHIGQKLFIDPSCVWDVLHQNPQPGVILCGPWGAQFYKKAPVGPYRSLITGDSVEIILFSQQAKVGESVLAELVSISKTGTVLTGKIVGPLQHSGTHGFLPGNEVEFTRDCVFDVKPV